MSDVPPITYIGIIVGAVIAFAGWKIYKALVMLTGFILGGLLGGILFALIAHEPWVGVAGFFIVGTLIAMLAWFIEKLSVAILSGLTGAQIVAEATKQIEVTYREIGIGIFRSRIPITETQYNWYAITLTFIGCAIIGWFLYKAITMLLTAAIGGMIVALSIAYAGVPASYTFGIGTVVFVAGAFVQAVEYLSLVKRKTKKEILKNFGTLVDEQIKSMQISKPTGSSNLATIANIEVVKEVVKVISDPKTQLQTIGTLFFSIAFFAYLAADTLLAIGSLLFLILASYVMSKLRKGEAVDPDLYLLLGIMGLPFALVIGGVLFLYSYLRSKQVKPTQTHEPLTPKPISEIPRPPGELTGFANEITKLFTNPRIQTQAIGTTFYFLAMLVYLAIYPPLAIGSLLFLLLTLYVTDKLRRNETMNPKLYLLLGVAGVPFALVVGGAIFLSLYFKEVKKE